LLSAPNPAAPNEERDAEHEHHRRTNRVHASPAIPILPSTLVDLRLGQPFLSPLNHTPTIATAVTICLTDVN
jgi:hypothetical protein